MLLRSPSLAELGVAGVPSACAVGVASGGTAWNALSVSGRGRALSPKAVSRLQHRRNADPAAHATRREEVTSMTKMTVRKPGAIRLTVVCAYYCPCCG